MVLFISLYVIVAMVSNKIEGTQCTLTQKLRV